MKRWLWAAFLIPLCVWAQTPPSDPIATDAVKAFNAGDYATARSLFEVLVDKNSKDMVARSYLRKIALQETGGGGDAGLEAALHSIILPKVDFHDVSARAAIAYISSQVSQVTGGKQVLNVVWIMPADEDPHVTLSLQNIPASEAMKYIAESAALQLAYDAHAVKITQLNPPAK